MKIQADEGSKQQRQRLENMWTPLHCIAPDCVARLWLLISVYLKCVATVKDACSSHWDVHSSSRSKHDIAGYCCQSSSVYHTTLMSSYVVIPFVFLPFQFVSGGLYIGEKLNISLSVCNQNSVLYLTDIVMNTGNNCISYQSKYHCCSLYFNIFIAKMS